MRSTRPRLRLARLPRGLVALALATIALGNQSAPAQVSPSAPPRPLRTPSPSPLPTPSPSPLPTPSASPMPTPSAIPVIDGAPPPSATGTNGAPGVSPSPSAAPSAQQPAPAAARPRWQRRIDRLVAGRAVSVAVGIEGTWLYRRKATVRRTPASNEKLLLSMAILDRLGPDHRMLTRASAARVDGRSVDGRLWILGSGDPDVDRSKMRALARRIKAAGIRRIRGRVLGSTGFFARDWWARGWRPYFPETEMPLPTALTFEGNRARGRHIRDPERRAAESLTSQLRARGIRVGGKPGAARAPKGLQDIATVSSRPLSDVLRRQNVDSRNFHAEVVGKLLGAARSGPPGTIRKGARAIEAWARSRNVRIEARDASGLSYRNRVSAEGMVRLLWAADGALWTNELRSGLPRAGQGTLGHRLHRVDVRAKTGTLQGISALSGWVRLDRSGRWAEFSILSKGMSKTASVRIEDRIVHAIAANAG
jgi:D-alanyl-D-alanine carboxypeptidase/D-alanyl-D-alanine-endopeptidase (penicillin-binding protein 4)